MAADDSLIHYVVALLMYCSITHVLPPTLKESGLWSCHEDLICYTKDNIDESGERYVRQGEVCP